MRKTSDEAATRTSAEPEAYGGYRVRGRVQGVGFRWWIRTEATRLGLAGTVKNEADGSVEVWARGQRDALADLRRLLGEGPPGSRVDEVAELRGERTIPKGSFRIVH